MCMAYRWLTHMEREFTLIFFINFIVLLNLYAFFHFCLLSIISSLLRSIIPPSLSVLLVFGLLIYCCPLYNFFPRNSEFFLFVFIYSRILTLW